MMRQTYLYLLCFVTIVSSCKKDYLDIKPKGKVIPSTYKDYRLLLNSTNSMAPSYGQDEFATDNVEFYEAQGLSYLGNSTYKLHTWQNNVYVSTDNDSQWSNLYKQIYLSNVVLDGMKTATGGSEKDRNQLIGEAMVHRAFAYFSLVNMYAAQYDASTASADPGVPLLLEATTSAQLVRASVQAVYDQVFLDLNKAVTLLSVTSTSAYEPSLPAAYSLLARASLQIGKYPDALQHASKTLELKGTLADYNDYAASPASIFPLSRNNPETLLLKNVSNSYSWFSMSHDLQNVFTSSVGDLRFQILFSTTQEPFVGYVYYMGEFLAFDTRTVGPTVAEMYLIRAECEARTNQPGLAMQDVNQLRKKRILKASYVDLTASSADDALLKVLAERRRELCFRGLRLFDLKRLNKESRFAKTLTHSYNGQQFELKPNDYRYLFPIAPKLSNLNPELTPNQRN